MSIHFTNNFMPLAKTLRKQFDSVQTDPHHPSRFQWDWWHLPGRYTHLRTPAELFFEPALHTRLVETITGYARKEFGCSAISPIWLSNYVEGCEQRLHADRPHGPWAFVFSLTADFRKFRGGETVILRDEILRFWEGSAAAGTLAGLAEGQAFEEDEIFHKIPSSFGRLLVFDPRVPHGVSRVSGTVNPLEGRLVLHGWFTAPQPFVDGALSPKKIEPVLQGLDRRMEAFSAVTEPGTVAYRISIRANGEVSKIKRLKSSMRESKALDRLIRHYFGSTKFPNSSGTSELTLPLTIG
jgi:hypothetical protein